jgi:hypothetical protein
MVGMLSEEGLDFIFEALLMIYQSSRGHIPGNNNFQCWQRRNSRVTLLTLIKKALTRFRREPDEFI